MTESRNSRSKKQVTEFQHQINVFKWSQQPSVRGKWPELALLFHIKNETKEGAQQVAVDRAAGVKKGVPDLCLPVPKGVYHGLYIELKTEKGRTSQAQDWWGEKLREQGYFWEVCHGWQSATRVLEWYLNLK